VEIGDLRKDRIGRRLHCERPLDPEGVGLGQGKGKDSRDPDREEDGDDGNGLQHDGSLDAGLGRMGEVETDTTERNSSWPGLSRPSTK
jgi:hypothetical protein